MTEDKWKVIDEPILLQYCWWNRIIILESLETFCDKFEKHF